MYISKKNIMIAFYISYYKSLFPYSIDVFNHILNYFRYIDISNIMYNSIKINYYFTPNINKNNYKVQENIINQPLYYYDNNYIYSNEDYKSIYNYDILLTNLFNIKDLSIQLSFYYNNKLICSINFNYIDIKNTNIIFDFYQYNFKLNNLHDFSPYNYFINNYINIDDNIIINNNINNNIINNNINNYIFKNFYNIDIINNSTVNVALSLKYLVIPDIISLF